MTINRNKLQAIGACAFIAFLLYMVWDFNNRVVEYTCDPEPITVSYDGQSLWTIAQEHCVGNLSRTVDDLVEKYGVTIYVGQQIQLKSSR
jgi:hypothetical protein